MKSTVKNTESAFEMNENHRSVPLISTPEEFYLREKMPFYSAVVNPISTIPLPYFCLLFLLGRRFYSRPKCFSCFSAYNNSTVTNTLQLITSLKQR